MGRGRGRGRGSGRWKKKDGKKGGGWSQDRKGERQRAYKEIVRENAKFDAFYKAQKIVPEEEWGAFVAALQASLPSAFRITGTRDSAKETLRQFEEHYFSQLETVTFPDGTSIDPPSPIPWYPDRLAWTMNAPRQFIRKSKELKTFHRFLVTQNEQGNISRQEAVSMIPPFLLDVKPHHKVLDMCAAPGSKTSQLIEMIHADSSVTIPEGLVVANDADNKRCYLLVHQAKRLQSPSFMITNHDASMFPTIFTENEKGERERLYFDRVLADVPCSGDGTLRKNPKIWETWSPNNGMGLHPLQERILARGVQLLADGGTIVYSTCSLNPIENEAVVASVLRKFKGTLELVDVSDKLPLLKRDPGLTDWSVILRNGRVITSAAEYEYEKPKICDSMFPPSEEEVGWMNLDRCCRLLPHHQDTGAFFVAVLRKVQKPKPLRRTRSKAAKDPEEAVVRPADPEQADGVYVVKEDPYVFINDEPDKTAIVDEIKDFYGLNESFPTECVLTRSEGGKKRHLYLVSPLTRAIIKGTIDDGLRITNTGVRVFTRSDSKDQARVFRLCQEGTEIVAPFMEKRVLRVPAEDLFKVLHDDTPRFEEFTEATQQALEALDEGAIAIVCDKGAPSLEATEEHQHTLPCDVRTTGWKGRATVRCLVSRHERYHFKLILGAPPALAEADGKAEKIANRKKNSEERAASEQQDTYAQKRSADEANAPSVSAAARSDGDNDEGSDENPTKKAHRAPEPSFLGGVWSFVRKFFTRSTE